MHNFKIPYLAKIVELVKVIELVKLVGLVELVVELLELRASTAT